MPRRSGILIIFYMMITIMTLGVLMWLVIRER
jgi:hypothetical protein